MQMTPCDLIIAARNKTVDVQNEYNLYMRQGLLGYTGVSIDMTNYTWGEALVELQYQLSDQALWRDKLRAKKKEFQNSATKAECLKLAKQMGIICNR